MEDSEQGQTVAANFPRPPPFYKSFTSENLLRLQDVRDRESGSDGVKTRPIGPDEAARLRELAPDLQYLVPPSPPTSGVYRSFGEHRDINESLPALPQTIEQLFPASLPEADRPHHLLKISKSLLLNFLEFVGLLAANPELAQPKVEDLRTLFFNAHQLINEYRPHQARESLIAMMEQRLAEKRAEVDDVKKMRETVDKLLAEVGEAKPEDEPAQLLHGEEDADDIDSQETPSSYTDPKRVWKALNAIEI